MGGTASSERESGYSWAVLYERWPKINDHAWPRVSFFRARCYDEPGCHLKNQRSRVGLALSLNMECGDCEKLVLSTRPPDVWFNRLSRV